jgi:L-aminopeptidase/D-esterase-like protein
LDAPTEGGAKGRARTDPPSRVLKFDFPSFKVGVAEYEEGPTGCTVFHFPEGAASAIDVRGGTWARTTTTSSTTPSAWPGLSPGA